jgi:hypothetical protein
MVGCATSRQQYVVGGGMIGLQVEDDVPCHILTGAAGGAGLCCVVL